MKAFYKIMMWKNFLQIPNTTLFFMRHCHAILSASQITYNIVFAFSRSSDALYSCGSDIVLFIWIHSQARWIYETHLPNLAEISDVVVLSDLEIIFPHVLIETIVCCR